MKKILLFIVLSLCSFAAEKSKIYSYSQESDAKVYNWKDLDFFDDYVVYEGDALIGQYIIQMPDSLEEPKEAEKFSKKVCKDSKTHREILITWDENYNVVEAKCLKK